MKDPLIVTRFVEWCARHFAEPSASNEDFQLNAKFNQEKELTIEFEVRSPTIYFVIFKYNLFLFLTRYVGELVNETLKCTTRVSGDTQEMLPFAMKPKTNAKGKLNCNNFFR